MLLNVLRYLKKKKKRKKGAVDILENADHKPELTSSLQTLTLPCVEDTLTGRKSGLPGETQ